MNWKDPGSSSLLSCHRHRVASHEKELRSRRCTATIVPSLAHFPCMLSIEYHACWVSTLITGAVVCTVAMDDLL